MSEKGPVTTEVNPVQCLQLPIADIANRRKRAVSDSFGGFDKPPFI